MTDVTVAQIVSGLLFVIGAVGIFHFLKKPSHAEGAATENVRWSPFEAVTITIAIYLLSQLVGGLILSGILVVTGGTGSLTDELLLRPSSQFMFMLAADAVALSLAYSFLKRRKTLLRAIGLIRPRWKDLLYAVLGFGAYIIAYIALVNIVQAIAPGFDLDQSQDLGFSASTAGRDLILVFVSLVILPPITEEILMRGFLYSGLRTKLSMVTAGLITSLLFAAAHLPEGTGGLFWIGAIDTFTLSLVLVYLREKTGSLWPAILLHAIKNGIAFAVLFVF